VNAISKSPDRRDLDARPVQLPAIGLHAGDIPVTEGQSDSEAAMRILTGQVLRLPKKMAKVRLTRVFPSDQV
jgi:hypothetical protein